MIFGEGRISRMFALFALIYTRIKDLISHKKKPLDSRPGKSHD